MTQRTCSSCGAHVALVEDRCRACGRDPDLRLLELGAREPRPSSGPARPRSVNWRRWAPVASVFVVLWAFLAFAGGGDGEGIPIEDAEGDTTTTTEAEDRTTITRRRRPPPTTTTQVIPGAPLLGEPTGLALAVTGSTARVIDLDTGATTRLGVRILAVTAGGLLVYDGDGVALWPPPYDGAGSTRILPLARADVIDQLWVVDDGRLVWVLERPVDERLFAPWSMSLIDLDGVPHGSFELPTEVWPAGATDHGVVVSGPGGVYLIDSGGDAARVSTGDPIAVTSDRIHVLNCDDVLRCEVEVLDGRGRPIARRPSPVDPFGWGTIAADGRFAQIEYGERGSYAVTVEGAPVFTEAASLNGGIGSGGLAWSPDGRWLAIAATDGVHVVDTLGDGGARLLDIEIVDPSSYVFFVLPAG